MTKLITITVSAPCECTKEQFEEWVKWTFNYIGNCSAENPLANCDLIAETIDIR